MNIQIRVLSAQAMAEFAKLSAAQKAFMLSNSKANAVAGASGAASQGGLMAMEKWGNKAQWAGRQLSYNFTMPLILAGGAAVKFALDNETALVRVQKVYGDATHGSVFYKKEIQSLSKAFEMLSSQFGVTQSDTINIAADWAAAGASGLALAKSTKLTMQTMILGEMSQVDATKALISIQAQYGESIDGLSTTIDVLNMVENQTGISMEGLVQGFQRAAGVARTAGIDVRHLAAFLAAMVPSAGTAQQAGNAIKTIVSRILSPTKEAAQVMGLFNINTKDMAWNSMNGAQRLEGLAKAYAKLTGPQKAIVATTLASRFQINKFDTVMRDIINPLGYYQKSLDSTANAQANFNQKVSELNQVLNSNPQRLKIIWTTLQNAMADVVQPMLPGIVALANAIMRWVTSFNNLSPALQKFILSAALSLALLGPILKYLGSIWTIIGYLGRGVVVASKGLGLFATTLWKIAAFPFVMVGKGLLLIGDMAMLMGTRIAKALMLDVAFAWFINSLKVLASQAAFWLGKMVWIATVKMAQFGLVLLVGMAKALAPVIAQLYYMLIPALASVFDVFAGIFVGLFTGVIAPGLGMFTTGAATAAGGMLALGSSAVVAGAEVTVAGTRFFGIGAIFSKIGGWMTAAGTALWAGLGAIWTGGMALLASITSVFGVALRNTWAVMQLGLLAITAGFKPAMIAIWTAMESALILGAKYLGIAMRGIWAGIEIALITGARALGIAYRAVWAAWHTALVVITTAFGTVIVPLWNGIMAMMAGIWAKGWALIKFITWTGVGNILVGIFALPGALAKLGPKLLALMLRFGKFLTSPWALAIGAVLLLVSAFHTQIATAWNSVVAWFQGAAPGIATAFAPLVKFFNSMVTGIENAFWRLPKGIRDAFLSVVKIVTSAAKAVYNMFSYLNPFAKHSPSLVDNVKKGMAVVGTHYQTVSKPAVFKKATADISAHTTAMASIGKGPFADEKANVTKGIPAMLPLFNSLMLDLTKLNAILKQDKAAVDAQQATVDKWKTALDAANVALDVQQKKLDDLQGNLDKLTTAYDAHSQAMQNYASAPITGMKAMNDAIFENSMAQKKLQLQMAQMGDAGNIDALRNKFALLQGEIEKLSGTQGDLRKAGAGSEILGAYDTQIAALRSQQTAVNSSLGPIADMQTALEDLQHQADIMDLQKSLQFDPLLKQIDEVVNVTKELTFAEIIAGVTKERAAMDALQPSIDAATLAVTKQKTVVDALTTARDAISNTYDIENSKLQLLNDEYSKTEGLVRDVESALSDMGSAASAAIAAADAAKSAKDVLTPGAQNFVNAGAADYPTVGGDAKIGRVGGVADQSAQIDAWVKANTKDMGDAFGKIDMWAPFKDMWNKGWKWMEDNIAPHVTGLVTAIRSTWNSLIGNLFNLQVDEGNLGNSVNKNAGVIEAKLREGLGKVTGAISSWWTDTIKPIVDLLAPDFVNAWNAIYAAGERIWKQLLPAIVDLMKELWPIIKVVAEILGGALLFAFKLIANIVGNVLAPILNGIIDVVTDVVRVIKGIAEVIVGVFSGDWSKIGQGLIDVFGGLINTIVDIFKSLGGLLWGVLTALVTTIIGFFQYLWDTLVGHSIIPDMINAIVDWFKNLGPWVLEHIKTFITDAVTWFGTLPGKVWDAVITLKDKLGQIASDGFNLWWTNAKLVWTTIGTWLAGLGATVWNWVKDIATKLGQIASDGFNLWWTNAKLVWTIIGTWLAGLGTAVWNWVKDIATKLGQIASDGFNNFINNAKALWEGAKGILGWLGGLGAAVWEKIKDIATKLSDIAKNAFDAFLTKAKELWDGKGGILSWFGGLAASVATKMAGIGTSVANAVKGAWNGAADWINKNGIANINKVTSHFGFTIGDLPRFDRGGIVPGGQSKTDNMLIAARSGEGVIVPEAVSALGGARGLNALNRIASSGGGLLDFMQKAGIQGYAGGGIIGNISDAWNATTGKIGDIGSSIGGWLEKGAGYALDAVISPLANLLRKSIPGDSFVEKYMAGMLDDLAKNAKTWGDKKDKDTAGAGGPLGSGSLGATGWQAMWSIVHDAFPGVQLTSSYRPGDPGWHGQGRAIDVAPPSMAIFNWIASKFGAKSLELIYSPAGARAIKNGKEVGMGFYGPDVTAAHYNHVHWAYDNGGYLKPGMTQVHNTSGKPEPVFSDVQWSTVKALVSLSASVLKSSVTGSLDSATGLRGASLVNAQSKLRGYGTPDTTQTSAGNGGKTEYHFHGDLSFPNIKNGEDAEVFLKNLKSLAGGK